MTEANVRLEPWAEHDLDLLRRFNTPEMTEHLGGPETEDQVVSRHLRYLRLGESGDGAGPMFRVVLEPGDEPVGNIGFWERGWQGEQIYETGWNVLPEFQGRGIAVAAGRRLVELARAAGKHRWLHAFPTIDNPPSNAICRKLGFTLLGPCDFEYPPGHPMRCHDWRLDLTAHPDLTGRLVTPPPAPAG
jgi:RimJ/RimL family protein N-acetyltransferase